MVIPIIVSLISDHRTHRWEACTEGSSTGQAGFWSMDMLTTPLSLGKWDPEEDPYVQMRTEVKLASRRSSVTFPLILPLCSTLGMGQTLPFTPLHKAKDISLFALTVSEIFLLSSSFYSFVWMGVHGLWQTLRYWDMTEECHEKQEYPNPASGHPFSRDSEGEVDKDDET